MGLPPAASAVLVLNNATASLGGKLTPLFIDSGAHLRLARSPLRDDLSTGESDRNKTRHLSCTPLKGLILVALNRYQYFNVCRYNQIREIFKVEDHVERRAKLDAGRVDTVFKVGDLVLLRTKELLDMGKLLPRAAP